MIKKTAALLLLLAFTAQTFSQGITLLHFYIIQKHIAATQCENRFRPMLHCNGKCALAKKMKQQEQNERQNPEKKLQGKEEVVSSRSFFTAVLASLLPLYIVYPVLADAATIDRPATIFHPPC